MCIIIHKPAGVPVPSTELLNNCQSSNPHGIGLMFNHGGKVIIYKGFSSVQALEDIIGEIEKVYCPAVDTTMILHFRYATHGKICSSNCHPFPTTSDEELLSSVAVECDCGVAHNGIIEIVDDHDTLSDTMIFVKEYLDGMSISEVLKAKNLIDAVIGPDKFIALGPEGQTVKIGRWIDSDDGCSYSNTSYKSFIRSKRRSISAHDDDDVIEEKCDLCGVQSNDVSKYSDVEGWSIMLCSECYEQNDEWLCEEETCEELDNEDEEEWLECEYEQEDDSDEYRMDDEYDIPPYSKIANEQWFIITTNGYSCDVCGRNIFKTEGYLIRDRAWCKECVHASYAGKKYGLYDNLHQAKFSSISPDKKEVLCV